MFFPSLQRPSFWTVYKKAKLTVLKTMCVAGGRRTIAGQDPVPASSLYFGDKARKNPQDGEVSCKTYFMGRLRGVKSQPTGR